MKVNSTRVLRVVNRNQTSKSHFEILPWIAYSERLACNESSTRCKKLNLESNSSTFLAKESLLPKLLLYD